MQLVLVRNVLAVFDTNRSGSVDWAEFHEVKMLTKNIHASVYRCCEGLSRDVFQGFVALLDSPHSNEPRMKRKELAEVWCKVIAGATTPNHECSSFRTL